MAGSRLHICYLLEGTAGMAMDVLDVITEDVVVEGTGIVIDIMNAYGVTSAFDAGAIGYTDMLESVLRRVETWIPRMVTRRI